MCGRTCLSADPHEKDEARLTKFRANNLGRLFKRSLTQAAVWEIIGPPDLSLSGLF